MSTTHETRKVWIVWDRRGESPFVAGIYSTWAKAIAAGNELMVANGKWRGYRYDDPDNQHTDFFCNKGNLAVTAGPLKVDVYPEAAND